MEEANTKTKKNLGAKKGTKSIIIGATEQLKHHVGVTERKRLHWCKEREDCIKIEAVKFRHFKVI